jgi:hypothetical protein
MISRIILASGVVLDWADTRRIMSDEPTETVPADDITEAFEALRREVSLTRSAVEGLTAARERIPDYSVTLGQMVDALKANGAGIGRIEGSPAVRLTPAVLVQEIIKASSDVRAEDARRLDDAREAIARSVGWIDGIVERGQAADRQSDRMMWSAAGGLLAGIALWSVLPGALARSLPESWHVPEWMAARTIGMNEAAAGERLTVVASRSVKQTDR